MIGKIDPKQEKVTVIGAGISGLLAGYQLKKLGYAVTIHEASPNVGGLLQTGTTPLGLYETAAHSLLVNEAGQKHFKELGLELCTVDSASRSRFILRNGKMRKMPLTALEFGNLLTQLFRKKKAIHDGATFREWGDHWIGAAATDWLIAPFVSGIFACDPSELIAQFAFSDLPNPDQHSLAAFFLAKQKQGPKKQRPKMMTFQNGMTDWIQALQKQLRAEIIVESQQVSIPEHGNVIIATPASAAAELIRNASDQNLSENLANIPYSPLVTATVFVHKSAFKNHPPCGVGVLIPRQERSKILGILFNSSAFPNRSTSADVVSLTVMLGGTGKPDAIEWPDIKIRHAVTESLEQILDFEGDPLQVQITRHTRAIPIYGTELKNTLAQLTHFANQRSGLVFFANWTGSVSLRGLLSESQNQFEKCALDHVSILKDADP